MPSREPSESSLIPVNMPAHYLTSLLLGMFAAVCLAEGYNPAPTNQSDALAATALANLKAYVASSSNQTCTFENAAKRREW